MTMTTVTIMATTKHFAMSIETAMTTITSVVMGAQDSVFMLQIPMGMCTAENMSRPAMTFRQVVYVAPPPLFTKELPRDRTLKVKSSLKWNEKG